MKSKVFFFYILKPNFISVDFIFFLTSNFVILKDFLEFWT